MLDESVIKARHQWRALPLTPITVHIPSSEFTWKKWRNQSVQDRGDHQIGGTIDDHCITASHESSSIKAKRGVTMWFFTHGFQSQIDHYINSVNNNPNLLTIRPWSNLSHKESRQTSGSHWEYAGHTLRICCICEFTKGYLKWSRISTYAPMILKNSMQNGQKDWKLASSKESSTMAPKNQSIILHLRIFHLACSFTIENRE